MQWFSAIFTAGMVTAAFYGLQYIVEQKMDVGFRHKGKWITDFTVILTLFVTFVGTMAVATGNVTISSHSGVALRSCCAYRD